jgi:hypothetical protein
VLMSETNSLSKLTTIAAAFEENANRGERCFEEILKLNKSPATLRNFALFLEVSVWGWGVGVGGARIKAGDREGEWMPRGGCKGVPAVLSVYHGLHIIAHSKQRHAGEWLQGDQGGCEPCAPTGCVWWWVGRAAGHQQPHAGAAGPDGGRGD